jgi:hypothetical protein
MNHCLIAVFSFFVSLSAFADDDASMSRYLESVTNKPLTVGEDDFLDLVSNSSSSRVLACVRADIDFFASVSGAICSDSHLNLYSVTAIGLGFSTGFAFSVFALSFRSDEQESPIEGTYLGLSAGFAYGMSGFTVGTFSRGTDDMNSSDQIQIFGLNAGASIDLSGNVLIVSPL